MATQQLKLMRMDALQFNPTGGDATRRIFEHWLFMAGRNPRRCKMGPTRRQAIDAALAIGYDEDTLLLAIEGMAADALDDVPKALMRDAMREIDWLLGSEKRIERWADLGERLRERADAEAQQALQRAVAGPAAEVATVDPAQAEQARQQLRALAQRMRQGADHG